MGDVLRLKIALPHDKIFYLIALLSVLAEFLFYSVYVFKKHNQMVNIYGLFCNIPASWTN